MEFTQEAITDCNGVKGNFLLKDNNCNHSTETMAAHARISAVFSFGLIFLTLPVYARDQAHWVCTGYVTVGNDISEKTKSSGRSLDVLTWVYLDVRAPDGQRRNISIEVYRNNSYYKGLVTTSSDVPHLKVVNVEDRTDVLFDGTVEVIGSGSGIEVEGKYSPKGTRAETIKATLQASDIP